MHISAIIMMVNASHVLYLIVQGSLLLINCMVLLCVEHPKFIFNKWRYFGLQSKCLPLDAKSIKTELL